MLRLTTVHTYTYAPTTNRLTGFVQGDVATPDAALQPISEWRYRFGPLQEREQKRQYSSDIPADGLAWTYTLLGADAKQLASYNGIQGAFCGQPPTTAWLWPVEYNSYGPAHTRLIMRPTGAVEYVLHDHLGSARITLDNAARVIESRSYTAFGDELTSSGTGARTSYIGRETDNESDLGFYGVRLYDPTYGRFLSTDPLWSKYLPLQSFQYCRNSPVLRTDRTGMADFFDEDGTLVGNNGIDDGVKFIGNASVYQSYQKDGYSFDDMTQLGGLYELPTSDQLSEIMAAIMTPALNPIGDASRREYGGILGANGSFYDAPPGPVATGASQGPEINLSPAFDKAATAGTEPFIVAHSHVNFKTKNEGTQIDGTITPSTDDRKMLSGLQYGYGLLILPRRDGPEKSRVTLFRSAKHNANGEVTDVHVSAGTLKKIAAEK
jgi:RHS repeat-associated protein